MLRIIVAGGRDFSDLDFMERQLIPLTRNYHAEEVQIVSGGAKGADTLGEQIAKMCECNLAIFPAQWDKYNKAAGYVRNQLMAQNADMLAAFWDGKSRGTKNMIDVAGKAGLEVHVFHY